MNVRHESAACAGVPVHIAKDGQPPVNANRLRGPRPPRPPGQLLALGVGIVVIDPAGTATAPAWNRSGRGDRPANRFTKNLVTVRVEGRYGIAVRRPSAFCQVDLTSA
jgi:hypothetical protein